MVAEEEDRANRFQQGLRLDIQKFLVTQQLGTYSQVLSATRWFGDLDISPNGLGNYPNSLLVYMLSYY